MNSSGGVFSISSPKISHAEVAEHLRAVCRADRSLDAENRVLLPNGQTRWMSWTNRALRDSEGNVTAIHSVGRDVDQRVQAEQRLKESEARYRLLAEHSTDMVIELDRDLKRRYVSPACREIFGYEPGELIGGTSGGMAHPDDAERLAQVLQSLLDGRVDRNIAVACRPTGMGAGFGSRRNIARSRIRRAARLPA